MDRERLKSITTNTLVPISVVGSLVVGAFWTAWAIRGHDAQTEISIESRLTRMEHKIDLVAAKVDDLVSTVRELKYSAVTRDEMHSTLEMFCALNPTLSKPPFFGSR